MKKLIGIFLLLISPHIYAVPAPTLNLTSGDESILLGAGVLTEGEAGEFLYTHEPTSFTDGLQFSLLPPGGIVENETLNIVFTDLLNISSFEWNLFKYESTNNTYTGSTSYVDGGSVTGFGFTELSFLGAGNYIINFLGTTSGTAGGAYTADLEFSPVPLPATVWLLITAMAGLITVGRRNGKLGAQAS